jgi:hypothetical protein
MFERHHESLISRNEFYRRLLRFAFLSVTLIGASIGIGALGYHYFEGLSWLDSLLNASMLLGGMGPVDRLHTTAGKLFASFYALYAGMVLLVAVGVMISPVVHRFLHYFHLEIKDDNGSQ